MDYWDVRPYPRFGELSVTLGADFAWYVSKPFQVEIEAGDLLTIRPGFRTDFASVPPVIRTMVRYRARANRPAVLHDYLYRYGDCPRRWADRKFRDGMEVEGMNAVMRCAFYDAVRAGGWVAWRRYRR